MRWFLAALFTLTGTSLLAQPADPRAYVFGGLSSPWEQGVTTDEYRTYLASPGGWAAGIFLGGGARLTRVISVEGEWHRTGIMETIEPSRYFITYSAQRRDTILAAGMRVHLALSRRFSLEPVGLFEFVREESWLAQRTDVLPSGPASGSLEDHAPFVNSWGTAVAGGVDLRAGGERFAVLPGVRVHRFRRDENAGSTWPGGRSNWGIEITAGLRADF
jgi:hypothetical protein